MLVVFVGRKPVVGRVGRLSRLRGVPKSLRGGVHGVAHTRVECEDRGVVLRQLGTAEKIAVEFFCFMQDSNVIGDVHIGGALAWVNIAYHG